MFNNFVQSNKRNIIIDFILDSNTYASTTLQHCDKLDFYFYNGQFYEYGAESHIEQRIREYFPHIKLTDKEVSKIITRIQDLSTVTDDFDNPRYSCYLNGILDTQTNQLLQFSPHYYITFQINQNYIDDSNNSLSRMSERLAMLNYL